MNQGIQTAIDQVMPAALQTGLFVKATVTFQTPLDTSAGFTQTGFPTGAYVDVPGLTDLQAMVAPTSILRVSGNTIKSLSEQEALNSSHVLLGGYYPDAEDAWRAGGRAVINGLTYENNDILAVESDSQKTQTRMAVRVVTI